MKKFMGLMEKYLMPLAMKMASNRHLNALKDGFVYTMPFLIIGHLVITNLSISLKNSIYKKREKNVNLYIIFRIEKTIDFFELPLFVEIFL
jgi:PTS system cellobiose-specific IIC component